MSLVGLLGTSICAVAKWRVELDVPRRFLTGPVAAGRPCLIVGDGDGAGVSQVEASPAEPDREVAIGGGPRRRGRASEGTKRRQAHPARRPRRFVRVKPAAGAGTPWLVLRVGDGTPGAGGASSTSAAFKVYQRGYGDLGRAGPHGHWSALDLPLARRFAPLVSLRGVLDPLPYSAVRRVAGGVRVRCGCGAWTRMRDRGW